MVEYNQLDLFKNTNKDNTEILSNINRRERQILVHSYLYYELGENLISDFEYDKIGKDLAQFKILHPEIFKQSKYYNEFKNFGEDDGTGCICTSAYDIPHNQIETIDNAFKILRYHQLKVRKGGVI